jgi:TonB-dependent receptor
MARKTKEKRDPVSLTISIVVHAAMIGGIGYWAAKTGKLDEITRRILQAVRSDKKEQKAEPAKPTQTKSQPSKLPPINQGAPPQAGGGSRRAVASDAPAAAGESFFADTRTQTRGPSSEGRGGETNSTGKAMAPVAPVKPPPPKPIFQSAAPKSDIKQLFVQRAKEAAATEAFGSEQISKTGVSDAGAIINKVSGAAVVDGKFAVIRGLSDRYVTTTLNGAEIPSPDPYRRSAPLDLFPAQIIDKVVVAKTFTPDQQGSYTGGGINIVTKSFPEKAFYNFSVGGSYNPQANLNDKFLTYDGGGTDWLGMDDGTRELPRALSADTVTMPTRPFSAPRANTPANTALREQRFADADRIESLTQSLGTAQFSPNEESSLLNHNFGVSGGDTTHFLGLPLGLFGAFSYRRDFSFYDDGKTGRYGSDGAGNAELDSSYSDARATETVNWSGMVNLAYQLHENHELGFNFLYNQNSEKIAQQQEGTISDDIGPTYYRNRLIWTERNLQTFQLKGSHRLPDLANIRIDWLSALAYTTQIEPDVRFFNYAREGGTFDVGRNNTPDPKQPTRYFRDLDENNRNSKIDLTVPFRNWDLDEGEFKLGFFDSFSKRTFTDRAISYSGDDPFDGNPNHYLTPSNLGYTPVTNGSGSVTFNWNRYIEPIRDSTYEAESGVRAGYLMLDMPVVSNLRLVGGVRYETTDIQVHSESALNSAVTSTNINNSRIEQTDVLPALGAIWSIRTNMNLRAHYSQTIARPSFRELAAYRSYDPILDDLLDGNPNLQMSSINNYDLRWEWFFNPGEIVSVSIFYKNLQDAIERKYLDINGSFITFDNRKEAKVYGVEFEGRKNLGFIDPMLDVFSVGGNVSLIWSETDLTDDEFSAKRALVNGAERTRQLYDQSPLHRESRPQLRQSVFGNQRESHLQHLWSAHHHCELEHRGCLRAAGTWS